MVKVALVAALVLGSATAQARLVEIVCKPNSKAKVSQFVASATFIIDDAGDVTGHVQYSTRSRPSAQTSDIRTVTVTGRLVIIAADELTTFKIESFQVAGDSKELVRMILNPDLKGPNASTLLIDRKNRYSSECRVAND